jgi:hypothetical protein
MRLLASILTALTLTAAAPAFGYDADARQVANKADRLAGAADYMAEVAYGNGRALLGNLADDVRREAIQLADAAFWASQRRGNVDAIIRPEWIDVRDNFQDLRARWQEIAPNVRDIELRQAWQATRDRFQVLRAEIRE